LAPFLGLSQGAIKALVVLPTIVHEKTMKTYKFFSFKGLWLLAQKK